MANSSIVRVILINLIVLVVLIGALFGGYLYYTNSINFVTSQDAQVTGTIVPITVQYAGRLNTWDAAVNTTVNQSDVLGTESNSSVLAMNPLLSGLVAHNATYRQRLDNAESILSPISGTIIQNNAQNGQVVQPGQVLAEVVNLGDLNVTANIPETEIRHVMVGQNVDVAIDGIPNTTFKGTVQSIGNATQSAFSLVPNISAASGSYTKVVQRIPVVISLNGGYSGKPVVPGMNAVVTIHVNNN
ncbi:HlyD family secretion protein [Ferroacidibacillus organovorans]|uniref:YknX-like beta-barrel domain-containing protein n=1 Tax=Ferroacidibacillus organovorans TaxID=1765683 RepID=A0A117SXB4_9BACL|nr:efflux RND transporter periplasmic adaptor subunit [Ferroacidibacillus organovorans]KUO95148.1 hypothetical protein ATW55_13425 [Ferroacidibacillus organovorans]